MAYLADKYAHLLSKDDLLELFSILERKCGSTSEACRKCGIQRKTRYDWEGTASVRLSTSRKVLRAFIGNMPDETMAFLLSRSKEIAVELLSLNLSSSYSHAMEKGITRRRFNNAVRRFEELRSEHAGLAWELGEEIGDMIYHLRERASILNVPLPTESMEVIRPQSVLEMIPAVIDALGRQGFQSPQRLAASLHTPLVLVQAVYDAARMLVPGATTEIPTSSQPAISRDMLAPTANTEYVGMQGTRPSWMI